VTISGGYRDWTGNTPKSDIGRMEHSTPETTSHAAREIKAVIFDYGQVLAYRAATEGFARMAEMFNVGVEPFIELWENSRGPYDRGDLTAEQYWLSLAAQTKSSIDQRQIETLREIEVDIWAHPIPDMLDWLRQLHAAGIKTALISNMPHDLIKYVRSNFDWMEIFAFKTFSAEVRLIKPDAEIYESTLKSLGISAKEALFIDDKEPNVAAARKLGMLGIQFRTVAQLRSELEKIGFPVLPVETHPMISSPAVAG
jgi:putative hydrolase of the HAD superfamily